MTKIKSYLFPATIKYDVVVYAEDPSQGISEIRANVSEIIAEARPSVSIAKSAFQTKEEIDQWDSGWLDAMPWGCEEDLTCSQIIDRDNSTDFAKSLDPASKDALLEKLVSKMSIQELEKLLSEPN